MKTDVWRVCTDAQFFYFDVLLQVLKRMPKELQHMQQWVMALPLLQVKRRSSGGGGSGDGGASRGITA